jgi:hypothetical protein
METRNTTSIPLEHPSAPEALDLRGLTPAAAPWSTAHKLIFQFIFCYVFLYLFPPAIVPRYFFMLPPPAAYENLWHKVVPWFAAHILHLSYPITFLTAVGSDSTYEYVKILLFAVISAIAAVVWSLLDRKRTEYAKLDQWLRFYVRLTLAANMLLYGADKVIPGQMLPPDLVNMVQPFGDITPFRLVWSFIGASHAYETFCGLVEMLGGVLLLIPGTSMLGALVSCAAMTQVFLLNMCYNIPVKTWAANLLLCGIFLILPDAQRLVNFLLLNRWTEPEYKPPLFERKRLNYSVLGVQIALCIYLVASNLTFASGFVHHVNAVKQTSPLYGIWSVGAFTVDGEARPPLLTDDLRWQQVIFDFGGTLHLNPAGPIMTIQGMNGQFSSYLAKVGAQGNTLSLAFPPVSLGEHYETHDILSLESSSGQGGKAELSYSQPQPDTMTLAGLVSGHQLSVTLKKEQRQFFLKTHAFSWTNDKF